MTHTEYPAELARYSRQILFSGIGLEGQHRISRSRVFVCGCGALGTVLAETLVRAGVGFVRVADRDFVEITNLQRQVLFDEQDLAEQLPKAVAAERKLRRINSQIEIEAHVTDVSASNILELAAGCDLLLDGTDNFETRFLLNDAALELNIPWIYAGCIGSHGQILPIFPHDSACLRCLMESIPLPGTTETCDTAGILGPTVNVIASLQAALALKFLAGGRAAITPQLTIVDLWDLSLRSLSVQSLYEAGTCPACQKGDRDWLRGERSSMTTVLCGRNAVQISFPERRPLAFADLAEKLRAVGTVQQNAFLLRLQPHGTEFELTAFPDGRAIIKGTDDPAQAKSLYARYFGA